MRPKTILTNHKGRLTVVVVASTGPAGEIAPSSRQLTVAVAKH
jgi:hypothetical protein